MNRRRALLGIAAGSAAATGGAVYGQTEDLAAGGRKGGISALLLSTTGATIGTFEIQRFVAINRQLHAIGVVTATDGVKTAIGALAVPVKVTSGGTTSTAQAEQATCPVLHLAIGPINLNLLGLVVTTQPIVVDIVAVPGPGNLLGNLLCAIAGLLDPSGAISNLARLIAALNQLLQILG